MGEASEEKRENGGQTVSKKDIQYEMFQITVLRVTGDIERMQVRADDDPMCEAYDVPEQQGNK